MTVKAKLCARCSTTKPTVCFRPDKRMSDGLNSWCRDCHQAYEKARNVARHPDRRRGVVGRKPKQVVDGRLVCGTCGTSKPTSDFAKDSKAATGFRARCKTCDSAAARVYHQKNRDKRLANARAWNQANGKRRWERVKSRPREKLADYLRSRMYRAIKAQLGCRPDRGRSESAVRDLGCTIPELMDHLERKFLPGMTWDNYGDWHIDHVKPLASFDLTDRVQFLLACHFSNLQPLWGADNISKGAKTPI